MAAGSGGRGCGQLEFPGAAFRPLYDRVLVRRDQAAAVSEGGIDLSAVKQERPCWGVVLAVGEGRRTPTGARPEGAGPICVALTVRPGDRVIFSKFGGFPIKLEGHEGEDLILLKEDEILGVAKR